MDAHHSGVIGVPDSGVLRISADSGRILVSNDRRTIPAQFVRFIQDRSAPGLIIVDQGLDIGTAMEDLLLIWAVTGAEEWRDQIGYLPL